VLPPVLERIQSLGFKVFTNGDYNLNLFGIRSPDRVSGTYDDLLGCAYKVDGQWVVRYWAATTDPSLYYRENPLNVKGTAILVPGQYSGVYTIDMHAGKYLALCQRNGPVTVWRDNDLDRVLDEDLETDTGFFGINIHASSSTPYDQTRDRDEDSDIGRFSAGCQVHATTTGFREMMDLVNKQIEAHPSWEKAFTYTLLDQWF
jgi:hypothetical protein